MAEQKKAKIGFGLFMSSATKAKEEEAIRLLREKMEKELKEKISQEETVLN